MSHAYEDLVGTAILGIDTLWGGDVMCASGTGRFIADSWFSDEPLPSAYSSPAAAAVRASGGVAAATQDSKAVEAYLSEVNIPEAIRGLKQQAASFEPARRDYVLGLAECFEIMWDLAMEIAGKGPAVPYERCVKGSTGKAPEPSGPKQKRERVAELLGCSHNLDKLLD